MVRGYVRDTPPGPARSRPYLPTTYPLGAGSASPTQHSNGGAMSVEGELNSLKSEFQGLKDSVRDLRNTINGNGKVGIAEQLRRVIGVLFANPDTGSPGLAKDVEDIKRMTAQARALWWFVSAFIVGAQAWQLVRSFGG